MVKGGGIREEVPGVKMGRNNQSSLEGGKSADQVGGGDTTGC